MKKLTAYNKDVQKFIDIQRYTLGNRSSKNKKNRIIQEIEKMVILNGESFERLFPPRSKRKNIMDEIVFMLSGSGVCKVESLTLAKKINCSPRTVFSTVRAIKDTGLFIVAGLADGKNKYVFVYKNHPNFQQIMKEVFFMENTKGDCK